MVIREPVLPSSKLGKGAILTYLYLVNNTFSLTLSDTKKLLSFIKVYTALQVGTEGF